MLAVRGIDNYYGKLHVLRALTIEVGRESVGLFGPNGAGKTTLINAIMGLARPARGEIVFEGRSLLGLEPHQIAHLGIALVPQERELFPLMAVKGNLESGAAHIPAAREKMKSTMEFVFELFPILKQRLGQPAGTLSGGEQRMLAIGRALMANPKLIILDEPSLGLQPSVVTHLFGTLKEIKQKASILLAEQNVRQSLKAIDRGYVLENGEIALEGDAASLAGNEHVKRSYLGL